MYIERQKNKTHVYTRYTPPFVTSKFSSATVDPCDALCRPVRRAVCPYLPTVFYGQRRFFFVINIVFLFFFVSPFHAHVQAETRPVRT